MDESNRVPPPSPVDPKMSESQPVVSDLIDITIKTIDSKNFQFQVENDIQIKAFKERIAEQVGIEPESQRMIFCGRVLSDDKTFKEYKIDNGKTIHLVKKAPPPQRNNSTSNNTSNNANQQNDRRRFHSYRTEDGGSLFMGTISLDNPQNILNQMVRQIFSQNRSNSGDGSADGQGSPLRSRINYIRRFLGYINTNFQILENPNQFPTPAIPGPESTDPQVLASEYTALFNEAFAISDRLRTHLTTYFQSLNAQPAENGEREGPNNHSILMRITHHLSHVMHLLSEFNIDYATANMPLTLNTLDTTSTSSTSTVGSSTTTTTTTTSTGNVSARIEISAPTSATSMPRFSTGSGSNAFFAQSPIVLMEVDTNINLPRGFMSGLRNFGSFPLSPENLASSNRSSQSSQNNSSANVTTSNSSSSTTSTTTTSSTTAASNSDSASGTNANQNSASSNSATSSSMNIDLGNFPLAITFDPYLNCNSSYTIPEVRSAANINNMNLMQQVLQSFGDLAGSLHEGGGVGMDFDPTSALISGLFPGLNSSSFNTPQGRDFVGLIRFIINQLATSGAELPTNLDNSSRIGDYLRNLNLFNNPDGSGSIFSDMISVLVENMNFEDLLNIVNSDFHDFSRFRQPFQGFIRNAFQCSDWSLDNLRSSVADFISTNHNTLITIIANINPAQGVDPIQSFQNFIKETIANFFHMIMSSNSDATFEADLMNALRYLVSSYIYFCRVCFADSNQAISQVITNYFEQYANFVNPQLRQFMTNMIMDRINAQTASLENDPSLASRVEQYIVRTDLGCSEMQVDATSEPDRQSISNDSEVEFADAISDFPTTSAPAQKVNSSEGEPQNWQSIMPNEWVPIINEDINKQKNIDAAHQPPFSDAYLNGMPKKRRLEHKPDDDENPEPKMKPKPQ